MPRGQVQALQGTAATYAGMVATFCGRMRCWQLQVLAGSLQQRLDAGAQPDILPLTLVPHVKTRRARALFRAGIRTVEALAAAPPARVEAALRAAAPARAQGAGPGGGLERHAAQQVQEAARRMLARSGLGQPSP